MKLSINLGQASPVFVKLRVLFLKGGKVLQDSFPGTFSWSIELLVFPLCNFIQIQKGVSSSKRQRRCVCIALTEKAQQVYDRFGDPNFQGVTSSVCRLKIPDGLGPDDRTVMQIYIKVPSEDALSLEVNDIEALVNPVVQVSHPFVLTFRNAVCYARDPAHAAAGFHELTVFLIADGTDGDTSELIGLCTDEKSR